MEVLNQKIIPLARLDKLLNKNQISKEEYIENCNKFFSMKRQKYRDVYYRRKEKFSQEDKTNLQEIDSLERTRKTLLEEKRILLVEIGTYHFMMRNNYCPLEP
ncbi:hypothetical protein LOD99_2937 [Oopsacas minuta]|uniref:Uncharacterized protein n=1 Tax=Oopsacas minuta TaxID=111878 RepID=A0AAV7JZH4_9METZ|nr:hypothetical protein LOD99_2937 [Oopsacas minuta]